MAESHLFSADEDDDQYGNFSLELAFDSDSELTDDASLRECQSEGKPDAGHARRFPTVSNAELEAIERQAKSKSTLKQTKWGVGLFKHWLKENGKEENFECMPEDQLADCLRMFYGSARSATGELYSKSTYVGLRASINRHLRSAPFLKTFSIMNDSLFHKANSVFTAMLKKLKREGFDRTKHYDPISEGDLLKLRTSSALCTDNPRGLQRKVWFDITLSFARRGRENLRSLTSESFVFKEDDLGHKYVEMLYHEATKNHQGDNLKDTDYESKPRMYATSETNCPVTSLSKYLSVRNPSNKIFFQNSRENVTGSDSIWYTTRPVGEKTLEQMMKNISVLAELSKIYTNHCVRATTLTRLSHAGVEAREIMRISGHRNEQSIKSYNSDSSDAQKRAYSAILHGCDSDKSQSTVQNNVLNYHNTVTSINNKLVLPTSVTTTPLQPPFWYSKQFEVHNSNINVYNYYGNQ